MTKAAAAGVQHGGQGEKVREAYVCPMVYYRILWTVRDFAVWVGLGDYNDGDGGGGGGRQGRFGTVLVWYRPRQGKQTTASEAVTTAAMPARELRRGVMSPRVQVL